MSEMVECPYCDQEMDVGSDYDGWDNCEFECEHCGKYFDVEVQHDVSFHASKDCGANNVSHQLIEDVRPSGYTIYLCKECGFMESISTDKPDEKLKAQVVEVGNI